jgi:hypothetical protein
MRLKCSSSALLLVLAAAACGGGGGTPTGSTAHRQRVLPHGIYFGQVTGVDTRASTVAFHVTNACGTHNSGTWTVPLAHATFDVNGSFDLQGPTNSVTRQEWLALPNLRSMWWRVDFRTDAAWFDHGPNPGCQPG